MKMGYIRTLCIMLCITLGVISCGNKKEKEGRSSALLQPKMALSKYDTTAVMNKTTEFLNLLKSNQIDAAVSHLYYLDKKGKLIPLPDRLAIRQKAIFKLFPVLNYKIDGIIFDTETDSQVRYTIEFFKKKLGDNRPNTTSFFIKPMRRNGQWFLTMYDSNTYNGGASEIKN